MSLRVSTSRLLVSGKTASRARLSGSWQTLTQLVVVFTPSQRQTLARRRLVVSLNVFCV